MLSLSLSLSYTHTCTHVHANTHTNTHTNKHTHMHTRTHAYTHTHTHTCTHTHTHYPSLSITSAKNGVLTVFDKVALSVRELCGIILSPSCEYDYDPFDQD